MSGDEQSEPLCNFSTTSPIVACRLQRGDLKRLYSLLNDKQLEYGKIVLAALKQGDNESLEQFEVRKTGVSRAFVTTVSITGTNGEVVNGQGGEFLESVNVPEQIRQVFFSTATTPTLAFPNYAVERKATVLLEFSRAPLLDFATLPTFPTKNNSNFAISSNSESWFTALNTRLNQFFLERKTPYDWVHRSGVYDLLLLFTAIPIALWIDFRLGSLKILQGAPTILLSAIYVYEFFIVLNIFRILFSYSRWVSPKSNYTPMVHRRDDIGPYGVQSWSESRPQSFGTP